MIVLVSFGQDGVYLVEEYHAGCAKSGYSEQSLHLLLAFAHQFLYQRRCRDREELAFAFCGHCLGKQSFAVAWWTVE